MRKLAFVMIVSLGAIAAQADVLWDQGPAHGSYRGNWYSTTGDQELADSFVLTQDSVITGYHHYTGGEYNDLNARSFHFALFADSNNAPGAELLSFDDDFDSAVYWGSMSGLSNHINQANFTFSPFAVSGGVKYWLAVTQNRPFGSACSAYGTMMGDGIFASRDAGYSWLTQTRLGDVVMQILGNPVPEPSTMIVLGIGAAVLVRRRGRK